ncbi:NADP-dependent oxidoreductase [Mangrovactinospora gilvigrisea]|uniref:NADP-dependent oxidoreductase n=1 Tax=Mangrovactinospora gilvigrisea TaxID=1428644 RepID=A0A1J7BHH4_9ACTN|nr:NADP-dependent oxidoreductase [Mangrovactinospora gilvigrisea]
METRLPETVREVRLAAVPEGVPAAEHFAVAEVPLPVPGDGELLVRNRRFLLHPGIRTLIAAVPGTPLPAIAPGGTLPGLAVGEVVAAAGGDGPRPGQLVAHPLSWREYAAVPVDAARVLDTAALPDPSAHLSQGEAAYGAFTRVAGLRPGETVLITGGAGSVGSLAGQIARLLGAARVIGTTGSPEKAELMVRRYGYHAALLRGPAAAGRSIGDQLAEAAPDGVDVVLDNVGGEQLEAALDHARAGARVVLLGALSGQLAADSDGGGRPVRFDSFAAVLRRLTLTGYQATAHPDVTDAWTERFARWLADGAITFPVTEVPGIAAAPRALQDLLTGRHTGTVVVDLDGAS